MATSMDDLCERVRSVVDQIYSEGLISGSRAAITMHVTCAGNSQTNPNVNEYEADAYFGYNR